MLGPRYLMQIVIDLTEEFEANNSVSQGSPNITCLLFNLVKV